MARGRKQHSGQAAAGPGTSACPLCGEVVPVGEDGRCDLGHRVRAPGASSTPAEPLSHVDLIERGVEVPAAGVAGLAAAGLAMADTVPLDEPAWTETVEPGSFEDVDIAPVESADAVTAQDAGDESGDVDLSGELDW